MKDWVMLIGTLIASLIVAAFAATLGLIPFAAACLLGGYAVAGRDSGYQAGQRMRAEAKHQSNDPG